MKFNEFLKEKRKELKMTQEDLAKKLYISRESISKWENGKEFPSQERLNDLENILNFNYNEIFESNNLEEKSLVVGTTRNIWDFYLCKRAREFRKLNTGTFINYKIGLPNILNDDLNNGKIDILIDYFPQINFGNNKYEIKTVGHFNTCFFCSKEYLEHYNAIIHNFEDLANQNVIIPGASRRQQSLDAYLNEKGITFKSDDRMPDSIGMAEYIEGTNFIGFGIEPELKYNDVAKLNLNEDLPINPFGVVYLKKSSDVVKKYIEIILNKNSLIKN